jgi:hypothetical protein
MRKDFGPLARYRIQDLIDLDRRQQQPEQVCESVTKFTGYPGQRPDDLTDLATPRSGHLRRGSTRGRPALSWFRFLPQIDSLVDPRLVGRILSAVLPFAPPPLVGEHLGGPGRQIDVADELGQSRRAAELS